MSVGLAHLDEAVDFVLVANDLEDDRVRGDVDHVGAKNVCDIEQFVPIDVVAADFHQRHLASDHVLVRQIADFDHVDELVELLFHLFDGRAFAIDDERQPAQPF